VYLRSVETVSSDVARQGAEIEAVIAGRTLCDELRQVAETSGADGAYSDEDGAGWQTLTWEQARRRVLEVAAGFAALRLAPGERVALMLPNRSGHVLADLGAAKPRPPGPAPVVFRPARSRHWQRTRRCWPRRRPR
jgi:acyl-CoA synthetase (AMP-forming)/AMP-acid ligase II